MNKEQRPHKFRAFDKEKKEWLWPYPEGFNIIGEVTVFDLLKQYRISDYKNLVIVQFIGLLDKKEREIYNGDIVKLFTYGKNDPRKIQLIEWHKDTCRFIVKKRGDSGMEPLYFDATHSFLDRCEVIGDIYQNPEMIGVK